MAKDHQPSVRYATREDVPIILALINELAEYEKSTDTVLATQEALGSTLSFPPFPSAGFAKTLLIFPPSLPQTPDSCAGMALFFHNYSTWNAAPGTYVEDLFVRPAYRGTGYGTRLLAEVAKETKRVGGKRLEWSVLKWNEPSIKFYVGPSVGAERLEDWVGMRVDGEALEKLAGGAGTIES